MNKESQSQPSIEATQKEVKVQFFVSGDVVHFPDQNSMFFQSLLSSYRYSEKAIKDLEGATIVSLMEYSLKKAISDYTVEITEKDGLATATFTKKDLSKVKVVGFIDLDKVEGVKDRYFPEMTEERRLFEAEDNAEFVAKQIAEERRLLDQNMDEFRNSLPKYLQFFPNEPKEVK